MKLETKSIKSNHKGYIHFIKYYDGRYIKLKELSIIIDNGHTYKSLYCRLFNKRGKKLKELEDLITPPRAYKNINRDDLFEGCTDEMKEALKSGNNKKLLNAV